MTLCISVVELALVEVREGTNGAVTFPSVTELPANMDNGRSYFEDRGTYVLLSLLSQKYFRILLSFYD